MSTNVLEIGIQIFYSDVSMLITKAWWLQAPFYGCLIFKGNRIWEGGWGFVFNAKPATKPVLRQSSQPCKQMPRAEMARGRGRQTNTDVLQTFIFPFPSYRFLSLWEGQTSLISGIKDSSVQNASSYLYVRNRLCPVDGRFVRTSLRRPKQ